MKSKILTLILGLSLLPLGLLNAQIVELKWNTFLGGECNSGYNLVLDSSGNIYVSGSSGSTWGSPVNAYNGGTDIYVACLNSSGNLLWNTFLGSSSIDYGLGIAIDGSDNVYVTGHSNATWGSPVNAHSGNSDAFVACLDSSGNLVWNTFLGSSCSDQAFGITVDNSGNVYITGESNATWGSPIYVHNGAQDAFVARLDSSPATCSGTPFWVLSQTNVAVLLL